MELRPVYEEVWTGEQDLVVGLPAHRSLHGLDVAPVGAEIVEYNPVGDVMDVTATVAVKFVKELLGMLLGE